MNELEYLKDARDSISEAIASLNMSKSGIEHRIKFLEISRFVKLLTDFLDSSGMKNQVFDLILGTPNDSSGPYSQSGLSLALNKRNSNCDRQ